MCGVEPIVYSNPELILPLSEKWIKDENKWIRRFGVVSLRGYKRIQITDKVFEIIDLIMDDKDKDVKEILQKADRALYEAKASGRNCSVIYT
jgi:3-methyladenine DNA glycosylase AlkD